MSVSDGCSHPRLDLSTTSTPRPQPQFRRTKRTSDYDDTAIAHLSRLIASALKVSLATELQFQNHAIKWSVGASFSLFSSITHLECRCALPHLVDKVARTIVQASRLCARTSVTLAP